MANGIVPALKRESEGIAHEIKRLIKRKARVDDLLEMYAKEDGNEATVSHDATYAKATSRGRRKECVLRRPTGTLITNLFLNAPSGTSYSIEQISEGIGFRTKYERSLVYKTLHYLVKRGRFELDSLGLYRLK